MKNNSPAVTPELVEETKKELIEIASSLDPKLLTEFCECIFTPIEIKDLVNRWLLVKEINNGVPQRIIAQKYGMSLCKITRGSKELNKPDSAFRKILDQRENKK
ncbi:MAG: transcriptional regulator [Treponema sp.]|nr:transcriptional regulator [Treponema sp.]